MCEDRRPREGACQGSVMLVPGSRPRLPDALRGLLSGNRWMRRLRYGSLGAGSRQIPCRGVGHLTDNVKSRGIRRRKNARERLCVDPMGWGWLGMAWTVAVMLSLLGAVLLTKLCLGVDRGIGVRVAVVTMRLARAISPASPGDFAGEPGSFGKRGDKAPSSGESWIRGSVV